MLVILVVGLICTCKINVIDKKHSRDMQKHNIELGIEGAMIIIFIFDSIIAYL